MISQPLRLSQQFHHPIAERFDHFRIGRGSETYRVAQTRRLGNSPVGVARRNIENIPAFHGKLLIYFKFIDEV